MKDREKKEIEKALFKEVNNKEKIIENCNDILGAKASLNSNVEKRYRRTQRRFAFISVACIIVIISIAMIVLLPPMFKPDGGDDEDETYYFGQGDMNRVYVEDIDDFIEKNNLPLKKLSIFDNYDNSGFAYYDDNDTLVGLEQGVFVIREDLTDVEMLVDVGTVFVYPSNYVIERYEDKIYNEVVIEGITVKYIEYEIGEEYTNHFLFSYQKCKYYCEINSSVGVDLEYYVKQLFNKDGQHSEEDFWDKYH